MEGLPADVQPFYQHAVLRPEEQQEPSGADLIEGQLYANGKPAGWKQPVG
eukprot:COSAG04_NODE_3860_length_2465_cov_1.976754_2_plen_50_part_00